MQKIKNVYIVHAVDTEGPLYESTKATFKRAYELFGIKIKNQTSANLEKLKKGIGYSGEQQKEIQRVFNSHLIDYNISWSMIKKMLAKISSKNFRKSIVDDIKNEYVLTWHCVDHVNYKFNPRKRTIGYGKIFKFYKDHIVKSKTRDKLGFHFHPMSIYQEAHRNATLWQRSDNLYQVLCRRIIDENWFPVANRAGFHVERPDSHLFLEQYIPFDLSNTNKKEKRSQDVVEAASGWDWRRAPNNWEIYNPSHDDYQTKGKCRRYIGRVLSINNRTESIDQTEVNKAFQRAYNGKNTLLAVTSHDFRNIETEILEFYSYIKKAKKKYPKVKYYFKDTVSGFQKTLNISNHKNDQIKLKIYKISKNKFRIKATQGKVFGPQPFLAIKFKNNRYLHDNLDFGLKKNEWFYTLGPDSVRVEDAKIIAVGAADIKGNFHTTQIKL